MDLEKIKAAAVCFAYIVCIAGPSVMLLSINRAAFVLLVAGLAAFGWPTVKTYFERLAK